MGALRNTTGKGRGERCRLDRRRVGFTVSVAGHHANPAWLALKDHEDSDVDDARHEGSATTD
jgi:hypothetical protein